MRFGQNLKSNATVTRVCCLMLFIQKTTTPHPCPAHGRQDASVFCDKLWQGGLGSQ